MDLRSDYPYWLLQKGIIKTYPSLYEDIHTQIVIMGGGISGALTAWYLVHAGFKVVLVDRRHIAMGSTAASTSLLQYEIDVPLHELTGLIGETKAVKSYLLCKDAIHELAGISQKLGAKNIFEQTPSFQFASYLKDKKSLEKEFSLRSKAGFDIEWLEESDIQEKYGFGSSCGILSATGAQVNAYALTHALLVKCVRRGLKVFDHTEVTAIHHHKSGIELLTKDNHKIKARKLVIACGYESQRYIPKKVQELNSTYVIISEPINQKHFWYKNSLIWETKRPYLYLRITSDHRIIVGGKDIPSSDPTRRDKLLNQKARGLEGSFTRLFPSIPFKTDFKWAGSFASTKDGLPYIGGIRQRPHTYFALGFGGNGITFSVIAGQMITDMVQGRKDKSAEIFSFDR